MMMKLAFFSIITIFRKIGIINDGDMWLRREKILLSQPVFLAKNPKNTKKTSEIVKKCEKSVKNTLK